MSACCNKLTHRLAEHGSWMSRHALAHNIGFGALVVDDCLSDMVVAGTALYNERSREYRLGGTLWARRALRKLARDDLKRAAVMGHTAATPSRRDRPGTPALVHVGMALCAPLAAGGEQLVMAELEIEHPGNAGVFEIADVMDRWAR